MVYSSLSFADISSPIDFVQKPITSRAHLLDIPLYLSRHSLAPLSAFSASSTISLATLVACAEESNVIIQPGDILVVRTGFTDELLKLTEEERDRLKKREVNGSCGVAQGKDILKWHWENGIAAVVSDWYAVCSFQGQMVSLTLLRFFQPFVRSLALTAAHRTSSVYFWLGSSDRRTL